MREKSVEEREPRPEVWAGWLFLRAQPGLGDRAVGRLMQAFPCAEQALEASPEELARLPDLPGRVHRILRRIPRIRPDRRIIDRTLRLGLRVVTLGGRDYPRSLSFIPDPPPVVFMQGDPTCLERSAVALVGSRSCSAAGRRVAEEIGFNLAQMELLVVSGMARGIDAAGHRGALEARGATAAVLGCGLDIVYPPSHRALRDAILEHGLLLSELPPGVPPAAPHFPRRNRIISGLSRAVILVEARGRSGALITADCALEQGRDVYAVPGPYGSPYSRGCGRLLREGATPITGPADLGALGSTTRSLLPETRRTTPPPGLDPEARALLERIPELGIGLDELLRSSPGTVERLRSSLLLLELSGAIRALPGGHYARSRGRPPRTRTRDRKGTNKDG